MATKSEILEVVSLLSGIYGKEPGDMRGYYWALENTSYDILMDAAQNWTRREKWMPAPAELRQACEPRQEKRHEYWRNAGLYGGMVAGRVGGERIETAVRRYFRLDR